MLHAIIMAGGAGTRFWPVSRQDKPKQLLQLLEGGSMLRQTFDRLGDLAPVQRRMVVTGKRLASAVQEDTPELPAESVIGEPCKRDTAPCIGLAALLVTKVQNDPDAIMLVLPADHVIEPEAAFRAAVRQAVSLVDQQPSRIVTFGIKPTYPAEIFGYIERGAPLEGVEGDSPVFRVNSFREKPNAETAAGFLSAGAYYWNSGIFVWRASTILDALAAHQPEMLRRLERIVSAWGGPDQDEVFENEFGAIEGISIDYAVMEHAQDVAVIEAPFDWDDLGGWQSLARRLGSDENGNTIVGEHVGVRTEGSIMHAGAGHLLVTVGLKDSLVVHTPDATLVANKHDEEAIRQVVKELQSRGWDKWL